MNESVVVPVSSDDWAALLPDTDHARLFRSTNWSATDLGPLSTWPFELRLYTIQAFGDVNPVNIWWGPGLTAIYNDAYVPFTGDRHPASLGANFNNIFAEVAHLIQPLFDQARATRKATILAEMPLTLRRTLVNEETWFDATLVPVVSHDGLVAGIYNTAHEKTRQKLTDRRSHMLNQISTPSTHFTSTTVYTHIADCLATNNYDIPFALLYAVQTESADGNHELELRASVGLSLTHPTKVDDGDAMLPFLRSVEQKPMTASFYDDFGGIDWGSVEWRGHQEPPQVFSVIPITGAERPHGYIVVGSNPHRPIDDDYTNFVSDLQRHITTAIVASISVEESLIRNARLEAQLAERERQVRYMAQHADICMMQLGPNGTLAWANERYHTVVSPGKENMPKETFIPSDQIFDGDVMPAKEAWQQVLSGERVNAKELRLQRKYVPPVGAAVHSTILLSAFPYMEYNEVKSVMACMTDVSQLKWAESWQAQLAEDAKEAKRQQSEFTDSISHEIRNPLSAILQLADDISRCCDAPLPTMKDCMDRLAETVEAAQTIVICAKHQKRIVDDVLTLSRLDMGSITLKPTSSRPQDLVQETLRIFEAEAKANSIFLNSTQEPSLAKYIAHQQVMCDWLRVSQVLINLISNAMKFTKAFPNQVSWASHRTPTHEDKITGKQWGDGTRVFLTFSVEDTGPGMTAKEMTRIFKRFQQASAKTSIQYGGSGLGLFISHDLIKKQGGQIGAISTPGKGSAFVFYVIGRLTTGPSLSPAAAQVSGSTQHLSNGINSLNASAIKSPEAISTPSPTTQPTKPKLKTRTTQPPPQSNLHLLLVEDNQINQQILRRQLQKAGCTVHVANHGLEALAVLRTSSLWRPNSSTSNNSAPPTSSLPHIDAILMDWEMPIMDGLTCTSEIRRLEAEGMFTVHPEVIAVTANARPEQVRTATEAGVDWLVPKPFTVAQILEVVNTRLKARKEGK
ncbi:hypothetical protein LTR05_007980 [Lithohypha guttulata]|uniref:Histidine kinase n=1 Tax=Lithohypha guttulata TaxID=1690604 RepID=A0AAN7YCZ2_9EURO|nr:hypothetical protein LTR05_007980 [Lithohypha guttulata]